MEDRSNKVFIVLDEEEQMLLKSICVDKDPEEALHFVLKKVAPKVHKKAPCLAGQLMRSEGR